jgi:hypothetical protein
MTLLFLLSSCNDRKWKEEVVYSKSKAEKIILRRAYGGMSEWHFSASIKSKNSELEFLKGDSALSFSAQWKDSKNIEIMFCKGEIEKFTSVLILGNNIEMQTLNVEIETNC